PGEESVAAAVAGQLPGCLDLCGKTDLLGLASVLRSADVMLSNDSGPMHLAAALGTRVVAPFTCTSPLRAGPHGPGHAAVPTTVSCAASYRRRCGTLHCMQELTPGRLWPALESALAAARAA
ncbi:MAG: glycosyltransferase family 9 protein, partial [Gemmataceae bacterium]